MTAAPGPYIITPTQRTYQGEMEDARIKQGVIRDNSCKIKLKMRYIPEKIGSIITGGWEEKDN